MKQINASATPKKKQTLLPEQEQIHLKTKQNLLRKGTKLFNIVKLQITNNDRAIVPNRIGQAKKSGHFKRS